MRISPDLPFTPEQEVLLWAIRVDHTKDGRIAEILASSVDWGYIRETAIQHGIIPLLYKRLKGEMADLVPLDELSTFRTLFMANAIRNIRMEQHLLKILDILVDSGVEAIPFKGPVLAIQAYGDLSMRSFCDLDVLIHTDDLSQACHVLNEHGYLLIDPVQTKTERILSIVYQKHLSFSFHDCFLELHWDIIEPLFAVPLNSDQIWDRSSPIFLNNHQIKTMSPEDMVVVLCFHGIKHGWHSLNWLADLVYTISNNPDIKWNDVFARAEHIGLKRIVLIGLFLAHKNGGIRYGFETENLFASDTKMLKIAEKIQFNLFQYQTLAWYRSLFYLMSRERFTDQIMFLFYFFTNKVLKFLKWLLQQITGIRTGPNKDMG